MDSSLQPTGKGEEPDIQDTIDASVYGDDILVASGTYHGPLIVKEGRRLLGGFEGSEIGFNLEMKKQYRATIEGGTTSTTVLMEGDSCLRGFYILDGKPIADHTGGGIGVRNSMGVHIEECVIKNNFANSTFLGAGGGIWVSSSQIVINNCAILNNISYSGGGMFAIDSDVICRNTLFADNKVGAGATLRESSATFINCTFGLGNSSDSFPSQNDLLTIDCSRPLLLINTIARSMRIRSCQPPPGDLFVNSNIPGGVGVGGIDADPQWIDPENGDYRLKISSPCIDSGTITDATMDLNGNPRPIDVVGTGKEGPGAYDMGAFEFQLSPADLTRNGTVDGEDLMEFQTQWMREE